jgi:hypothetical protein
MFAMPAYQPSCYLIHSEYDDERTRAHISNTFFCSEAEPTMTGINYDSKILHKTKGDTYHLAYMEMRKYVGLETEFNVFRDMHTEKEYLDNWFKKHYVVLKFIVKPEEEEPSSG